MARGKSIFRQRIFGTNFEIEDIAEENMGLGGVCLSRKNGAHLCLRRREGALQGILSSEGKQSVRLSRRGL